MRTQWHNETSMFMFIIRNERMRARILFKRIVNRFRWKRHRCERKKSCHIWFPLSYSIRFLFINGQELCNSIRWRQREFMWWFVCVSFWFRFSFGIPFDMESAHNILCMCEFVVVNRTGEEEKVNERSEERKKKCWNNCHFIWNSSGKREVSRKEACGWQLQMRW